MSTLRLRSNWMMIVVVPSEETDVSSLTPEIVPMARSSGAATLAAMVIGSAPGRLALTRTTGNSMAGRLETGRKA